MTTWKLARGGHVASTVLGNGHVESRLVSAIPPEDTILPADPPTQQEIDADARLAQNIADIAAARLYTKLTTLSGLTPAQVQAWMAANVQTPGQIQDVTTTLAVATGILWRDKQ